MYYKGYITYKNKASNSFTGFKLIMTTPPEYVHSEIKHDTYNIPGRDGELYSKNTYRGNATIKVSFDIVTTGAVANYTTALNQIYLWLSGTGNLIISDEPGAFYEVKKVIITTDQRTIVRYGKIDVEFVVYPYKFLDQSQQSTTALTIINNYDECYPLYEYIALYAGQTETLTVNNSTMTIYMLQNYSKAYIDTRKKIAYHVSGQGLKTEILVDGDYEKLKFAANSTNILSTTNSSVLSTLPRWGYKI